MTEKFPELFVNDDELQRELTKKIGAQFAFSFGPLWGGKKRAGVPDALRSKDSVAVRESDGTISVFDMFSSSLAILVNDGDAPAPGTHANLPPSEATFMADAPFDYLGAGPVDPPDPPDDELEARVVALEEQVAVLHAAGLSQHAWLSELTGKVTSLEQRTAALEAQAAQPLKVIGKTSATWGHQHTINLDVTRVGDDTTNSRPAPAARAHGGRVARRRLR